MCDSLVLIAFIDDLPDVAYTGCKYPFRNSSDPDRSWIEFRDILAISPLTGAGFVITPFGVLDKEAGKRSMHGRIGGYRVSVNPPACLIGHNRMVVNSVYQGAKACMGLLKFWLALNGCTAEGLNHIQFALARLQTVTPLFLFPEETAMAAYGLLDQTRGHSQALLNDANRSDPEKKKVAYTWSKDNDPDATYSLYIADREYKIACYVKEHDQPDAFLLPLEDQSLEAEVEDYASRTFRLENRVYEKWLKDKFLDDPMAWKDEDAPYELIFNLMRGKLRLDDGLRDKRMKVTTVDSLKLNASDKELLKWHLAGNKVLRHTTFTRVKEQRNRKAKYYAARKRIFDASNICIYMEYETQIKKLAHGLSEKLAYPGELVPPMHFEQFVFSRASADPAIMHLSEITKAVLEHGPSAVPALPSREPKVNANRLEYKSQFMRGETDEPADDDDDF